MFNNLIETNAKRQRSVGGTFMSFLLHGGLIALAVVATASAGQQEEKPKDEKVEFVETPKDEPPPPEPEPERAPPPPPDVVAAPPPPKGFQVLQAPVEIPDVIPKIDLNRKAIDEADFSGKGVAGGTSKGVEGAPPAPVTDNQTYFEFQVEKPVVALNNAAPTYPSMLQNQGVAGQVIAQFVVDTTGRVDISTFKVIESSHDLFSSAVKNSLSRMRFQPAEVGGRKVKQLVQQPFVFNLGK
jgi:periplasmic protein TonB